MTAVLWRGTLCAVLVLRAATAHAHTLASTVVSVKMTQPGTVSVTIAAEADPFIAKLEALAGITTSDPPTIREDRRSRIESLFPTLRAHIDARATGIPVVLELRNIAVDDTAQAEIHLTAKVGDGPHTFMWRCTFIFGAYQLVTINGDAAEQVQWLQGPQTSAPITLEPMPAASGASIGGSAGLRIGHSLAMGVFVVYVLRRRRNAQRLTGS